MVINTNSTLEEIFEQYLTLVNPILGTKRMKPLELKVFSKLVYAQYHFRNLPKDKQSKVLFSSQFKKNIREEIGTLSEASFNNIILSLRKKELIKGTKLNILVPLENNKIEVNIVLNLIENESI